MASRVARLLTLLSVLLLEVGVAGLRPPAAPPAPASDKENFSKMPKNLLLKSYARQIRSPTRPSKRADLAPSASVAPVAIPEPRQRDAPVERNADGVPVAQLRATRPIVSGGSGTKRIMSQGKEREREIINPNRLRVIAGSAKGKKIDSPDVYLRPMMAKVREALFSTLSFMDVFAANTTRVLDTFCGSGSVGLEALSRGGAACCFVDLSPDCAATGVPTPLHLPIRTSCASSHAQPRVVWVQRTGLSRMCAH